MEESTCIGVEYIYYSDTEESAVRPSRTFSQAPGRDTHTVPVASDQRSAFSGHPSQNSAPEVTYFKTQSHLVLSLIIFHLNVSFDSCHFTGPRGLALVRQFLECATSY